MKKLSLLLIGLLLIPTLFLTSCDKGDDTLVVSVPAQKLMVDYMLANNRDISNILSSTDGANFVVGAPPEADLASFLAKYYIIDIRSAADYAKSHISGAKNIPFANILAEGTTAGAKPVLVVCYSGQVACYATALMRLSGFKNTQALKWGMSGWNSTTAGAWNSNIKGNITSASNWTYDGAPANMVYTKPVISSLSTDGAIILKNRIETVVAEGFKTVAPGDVLAAPNSYFINNYYSAADYSSFGHIKGAYRINPLTLADNSYLGIDPSAKVITYCYTGQTSAIITACLRVLGYDAYSLFFGVNGMYNDNPAWGTNPNKWSPSSSKNLPLVQ
ncbi:MAG: rhodanese-like domain-containing protein [Lutibacter sp.]